ncbi:anti-sigma factor antagonist [Actinokineospora auranticolor]|uniref:Anti-sigma factor antagonist n=1 Tax=Actinokineospora auranticolor TaxID=155976 RepID=A0A2S6H068_9PSEU|nr:anti-sigma factor antagonist [Actinokineospora auranticolor]PPK70875.1 anti-anti-sigma factor [Actinokineospora auranticolor]
MAPRIPNQLIPAPRRAAPARYPVATRVDLVGRWAAVAAVRGEIDLVTAPRVRAALLGALAPPDLLLLVVDLSDVDFLAAAGLGVLVDVRDRARARAVDLRLVADRRSVLRPLDVTGLRQSFRVHADRRALLAPHLFAHR